MCVCVRYLCDHSIQLLQLGSQLAHLASVAALLLLLFRRQAPPQVVELRLLLLLKLSLHRKQSWRRSVNETMLSFRQQDCSDFPLRQRVPRPRLTPDYWLAHFRWSNARYQARGGKKKVPSTLKPSTSEDKKLRSIHLAAAQMRATQTRVQWGRFRGVRQTDKNTSAYMMVGLCENWVWLKLQWDSGQDKALTAGINWYSWRFRGHIHTHTHKIILSHCIMRFQTGVQIWMTRKEREKKKDGDRYIWTWFKPSLYEGSRFKNFETCSTFILQSKSALFYLQLINPVFQPLLWLDFEKLHLFQEVLALPRGLLLELSATRLQLSGRGPPQLLQHKKVSVVTL